MSVQAADIEIYNPGGMGFFTIKARTAVGTVWLRENVQSFAHGRVYTDDRRLAENIAGAAIECGLVVA